MRKFAKKFTKLKQKFRIFSRTFSFGGNPSLYPCMQDTWNAGIIKLYEELKSNTTDIKMKNKKRTRPPEILKRSSRESPFVEAHVLFTSILFLLFFQWKISSFFQLENFLHTFFSRNPQSFS